MAERKLTALLLALHDAGVEFIVVGGLAAVLNGAPINTYDVDIVHRRTLENIDRLIQVLQTLDAVYRIQPERHLLPAKSALMSAGRQNLPTNYGPLDVLGSIGKGRSYELSYEELLPHSIEMLITEDVSVRILDLETLIELKEILDGEKDRAMLPILRRTLEEKKR